MKSADFQATHLPFNEACARMGISTRTGRREVAAGNIAAFRVGRNKHVTVAETERYISARVTAADAEAARRREARAKAVVAA